MSPGNWAQVQTRLQRAGFALDGLDQEALRKVLTPVLALARGIEQFAPTLPDKGRIRVAVVGAEWLDGLDGGRWYSLLGPLLERPLAVEGVLIGPQLESGSEGSVNALVSDAPAFTRVRDTLQHFIEKDGRDIDLAVIFQPGLDSETALLDPPGPAPLLSAGVPVLGSSYSRDEFLMEREILQAFGYGCRGPADNPLALDVGREEAHWGAILWALDPARIPTGAPDLGAVAAVQRLSRMLAHSKLQGMLVPLERLGESVALPRREGGERTMIYLFDAFYVASDTGEVYMVDGSALRPTEVRIEAGDLRDYPGSTAEGLDRALWAARIKEDYLLRRD